MEEQKNLVDPTNFDLIIIGTGLPQSIIAAASSTAGKTVLHLDPNPFYGSHFSSLSPPDFALAVNTSTAIDDHHHHHHQSTVAVNDTDIDNVDVEFNSVSLSSRSLYSNVDVDDTACLCGSYSSSRFLVDVSGPRVLFSADSCIDLFLKSGVHHCLEFKAVDVCLIFDSVSRRFFAVPDSRSAIFKDQSLSLTDKLCLNKFFKLVQLHLGGDEADGLISPEDLESPFARFLDKNNLPLKAKWFILYAIALADYDQEDVKAPEHLINTKEGIDRLAMYHSSIGRFPNAPGAMLYPMYGQGELPQVFCRRAAVKGSIYVLRMPVTALLADKGSGIYKGVRLASGQDLFSEKLLLDPQFLVPQALASSSPGGLCGSPQNCSPRNLKQVARGICISKTSLKPDASNLLIVIPPRSLYPEQATSVRVLQLGSNSAVCPTGMFVLYLSALCDDASQGKKLLNAAKNALFGQPICGCSETETSEKSLGNIVAQGADTDEQKSPLVWSASYIQEITEEAVHTISRSPSPDGDLSYNSLINITKKMFQEMFPGEEFFPENASAEDPDNVEDTGFE